MFQKRNDLDLINCIRLKPKHIRKIASELDLPPSTVHRLVNQLESENVLDFSIEGRNKSYFLKNSLESKQYLFMLENYLLLKVLHIPSLRRVIKDLILNTSGELIVLFGSYAKGTFTSKSDIDVYVETTSRSLQKKLSSLSDKLSVKIGSFGKSPYLSQEIILNRIIVQNIDRYYCVIKDETK